MNNQQPAPATTSRQRKSDAGRGTKAKEKINARPAALVGNEPSKSAHARSKQLSKQNQLAELLLRDEGATIAQMIDATGWLAHTVRAALTGLKKKGYGVDSDKVGGIRTYRAVAPR